MSVLPISSINERQCLSQSLQGISGLDSSGKEKRKVL